MQVARSLGTMTRMRFLGAIVLLACADACAHPGHGAAAVHVHEWDLARWFFWIAVAGVAAFAAWKKK